jgi:flagellar M-ring protein FliF
MSGARNILQNLTPRGRLVLGLSVLGIAVAMLLLVRIASQPSYTTLLSGLEPGDTGKMTKALDEQGIGYELQNNGTAIAVEKAQVAQARIALAEGGLTGNDKPGFELFDKQKLGASDFQQRVSYQRALEGEVARTIGQVSGVSDVQVQITLPEDELFAEEAKSATAAVLLSTAAGGLDPASVRGIARLVASSVEGLKPENVTITDQTGALLWPNGEGGAGGGEGAVTAGTRQAAEARVERELEAGLGALIARTVGPDRGQVQVQAAVDANETSEEQLRYARRGVPLRQRTEEEQLEGAGPRGGRGGTDGNIPSYAQGGGGASNYERTSEDTEFGVDKTVTRTRIAPGTVEGLDIAVVLDKSVPAADVRALREAVASAAGIDEERGDTLSVSQIAFAKPPAPKQPTALGDPLGMAKYGALGLGLLIFLIAVMRQLRRREGDELASEPVWLRELDGPTTLAELEAAEPTVRLNGNGNGRRNGNGNGNGLHHEVEGIVTREPDRVAQQVRAWINEQ